MRPSSDDASLRWNSGRPARRRSRKPALISAASRAPSPTSTAMPASRSRACPWPFTEGFGSSMADTTRATPARTRASAHGGDLPKCEQGSSVTYTVASRAASPALLSASTSACGRPPSCVRPRATMRPSLTMTQPTAGFGQVRPSERRASASAARIMASVLEVGLGEIGDELLEVAGLAEIAIDRGKPHIGHRIERAQRVHHQLADLRRGDLALAGAFQAPDDAVHHALDALGIDRPLAAGDRDRAGELVAVELHALAVLLDHRELAQLHAFEGGEARSARRAVAPPADRRIVVSRSRVLNLCVLVTAKWTAHSLPLLPFALASVSVNRKAGTKRVNLGAHLRLDLGVAVRAVLGDAVEHVGDQMADLAELRHAEAARGAGGRPQSHAGRDGVLLRIAWNAVLVDG